MQKNDFDVRAARERLELGTEALAAELRVTEGEVRAWESGSIRIPRRLRQILEYRVAHAEWSAGMASSGLPECEWLAAEQEKFNQPLGSKQLLKIAESVAAHMKTCGVCSAREQWAKEHLPPLPPVPLGGMPGFLHSLQAAVKRLPEWARPAAWGALAMAGMTGFRALVFIPAMDARGALEALGVVLLAGAGGAVGGLAFSLTRPTAKRMGAAGNYLGGIVAAAAMVGVLAVAAPLLGAEPLIVDRASAIVFTLVAIGAGLIAGKAISDFSRPQADGPGA